MQALKAIKLPAGPSTSGLLVPVTVLMGLAYVIDHGGRIMRHGKDVRTVNPEWHAATEKAARLNKANPISYAR